MGEERGDSQFAIACGEGTQDHRSVIILSNLRSLNNKVDEIRAYDEIRAFLALLRIPRSVFTVLHGELAPT